MLANPNAALARLRRICASWPEVIETTTFGHPTFQAGKKTFVVLEKYRGEYAIAFKATLDDQVFLIADPRFYATPYVGRHGWTSLRLTDRIDWEEVEALVWSSYRLVAPKRALRLLAERSRARAPKHK